MATTTAGVQSSIDVNQTSVIPVVAATLQPHIWSWIWFIVAVLIIMGFHIRMFGRAVPPAARFP